MDYWLVLSHNLFMISSPAQQRIFEVGQLFVLLRFWPRNVDQIFEGYVFLHPEVGQILRDYNILAQTPSLSQNQHCGSDPTPLDVLM